MSKPVPVKKNVYPRDAKIGQEFAVGGVAIKLIEVNVQHFKLIPDIYNVAYKIIDNRVSPAFVSEIAHLHLNASSNVTEEVQKVIDHYDQIKEDIFNVKVPKAEKKQ